MCFGLQFIEDVLLWIVIAGVVIALLRLLVAFVVPRWGWSAEIVSFITSAIRIVFWGVICIAAIFFIFALISCLPWPSLPRVR